jgi:uncharacterized DUF497 family protein
MNFEWDEGKNEVNIDKHGFDFADSYRIFNLPMAVELDGRDDNSEDRWIGTGKVLPIVKTKNDKS